MKAHYCEFGTVQGLLDKKSLVQFQNDVHKGSRYSCIDESVGWCLINIFSFHQWLHLPGYLIDISNQTIMDYLPWSNIVLVFCKLRKNIGCKVAAFLESWSRKLYPSHQFLGRYLQYWEFPILAWGGVALNPYNYSSFWKNYIFSFEIYFGYFM